MATNKDWDQILAQALQEDLDAKMAQLPPENEVDFEFSEEFESDMQKLLNRASKPYYYFINTVGKRVAVIAVVLFIALTTTVFSVEALRKPVVKFFVTFFEKFSTVVFGAEAPDSKLHISSDDFYIPAFVNSHVSSKGVSDNVSSESYNESSDTISDKENSEGNQNSTVPSRYIESSSENAFSHTTTSQTSNYSKTSSESSQPVSSYPQTSSDLPVSSEQKPEPEPSFPKVIETIRKPDIPDGYELDYEEKTDGSHYIEYVNQEGDFFTFEQHIITTMKITVDTENIFLINTKINGYDAIYYENKGYGNLLWTDGEYGYAIIGIPDQELLSKIAESVK